MLKHFDPFTEVPHMKQHRLLDCNVAKYVFGWTDLFCLENGNVPYGYPDDDWNNDDRNHMHSEEVLHYSTEWNDTGLILEKAKSDGIQSIKLVKDSMGWVAQFEGGKIANSNNPCEAICHAAINYYKATAK